MWPCRSAGLDCHLDLTGDQIGHHRRAALIGNMHDVDAEARAKHLAGHMLGAAESRRTEIHLSGICLDPGNQFADGFRGHRWIDDQDVWHLRSNCNRLEILLEVIRQGFVKARRDRMRDGREEHRVAVGRRFRDNAGRERPSRTGLVFHHDGLTEFLRQSLSDGARDQICCPARGKRHDQRDRPRPAIPAPSRASRRTAMQ